MKEWALVDGDLVAYRCSASAEKEEEKNVALWRVDCLMDRLLHETNTMQCKVFLTGEDNFRKIVYPEYKANRKDYIPPKWLQDCREHLVKHWKAKIVNDIEADDALGISLTEYGEDAVCISLDKDLLQIPGWHYQWEISGTSSKGKQWTKEAASYFISPLDGLRKFYSQVITGDAADNVPAFDGKFRNSTPLFVQKLLDPLYEMTEEWEMYEHVRSLYYNEFSLDPRQGEETMHRNAKVLYIMKKENDYWQPPKNGPTVE